MGMKKGFYFSLDALTASTVLIAVTGFLMAYNPSPGVQTGQEIDALHVSAEQEYGEWNKSSGKSEKVLTQIYHHYYSGNSSEAEKLCEKYYNLDKYALYFKNSTDRDKACGNLKVNNQDNLVVDETPVTDVKINGSFIGPKTGLMTVVDN